MPASLPTDPAPRLDPTVMAMVVVREFFDGAVRVRSEDLW